MRRVVHISDLHFGRTDPAVVAAVCRDTLALQPDLLVVSGDLTQRARPAEFRAARSFLDQMPFPRIVVPGNHDVPLYNVFSRLFLPTAGYRKHVSSNLTPEFIDARLAVFGICTARSLTIKNGRISTRQFEHLRQRIAGLPADCIKVLVTHHPCDLPEGSDLTDLVGRADQMMPRLINLGFDLFLSGHLHHAHHRSTAIRHSDAHRAAVMVQAGTATSTRLRGCANSYNVLTIEAQRITVEHRVWHDGMTGFAVDHLERYHRGAAGWSA